MFRLFLFLVLMPAGLPAQEALLFREDFTGQAIAPELRIVNSDPERMALVGDDHLIVVSHQEPRNTLEYAGQLPENFRAVVKIDEGPAAEYQTVRLEVGSGGKRVAVIFDISYSGRCQFDKQLGDEVSTYRTTGKGRLVPLYLGIEKNGVEVSGFCASSPAADSVTGKHIVIGLKGPVRLVAQNTSASAPESGMSIDWIEITELK